MVKLSSIITHLKGDNNINSLSENLKCNNVFTQIIELTLFRQSFTKLIKEGIVTLVKWVPVLVLPKPNLLSSPSMKWLEEFLLRWLN